MLKNKLLSAFITLLFPLSSFTQGTARQPDFTQVDNFAKTITGKDDVYTLTKELIVPYSDQLLQARSLFIWITENIAYDHVFINKGKEIKRPECKPGENCKEIREEWEKAYIKKILKDKEAICDGYVRVFKKMCDIAGIKCEIIGGYTKTRPYQIGNIGGVHHAWNSVYIDSAWHLIDATWAAGGCAEDEETGKLLPFRKRFNNYYWFTSFSDFTRNHYPKDAKWVMEANYTKEKFTNDPWYTGEILPQIQLLQPTTGILPAKKGDTIHFKFVSKVEIGHIQINNTFFRNPPTWQVEEINGRKIGVRDTAAVRKQQYLPFKQEGTTYEFDYVLPDNSVYYLDILFDYRRVMRFNVKTS